MKITVITVCFNSAETIEKAIQSVISQDYPDKEYIIVDGGSTDGTIDIIIKYEDFITKWVSERDKGIFDAMNKGIGMAEGDVIAFLNSDDWYVESALSKVQKLFEETKCDCVCCDNYVIKEDGKLVCYDVSDVPLDDMYKRMIYYHSAIFAKSNFFARENNFDLTYKIAADYDWMLRTMKRGAKVSYLHVPIFTFCYGGISSVNEIACAREAREIASRHLPKDREGYLEEIDKRYFRIVMQGSGEEAIFRSFQSVIGNDYPVAIWGAGKRGKQCLDWFHKIGIKVMAVIDSNEDNWGAAIKEVKIQPPQFLLGKPYNVIITPAQYTMEIQKEIDSMQGTYFVHELKDLYKRIAENIEVL